jgi:hypothetical protein
MITAAKAATQLANSAMRQKRLIVEHACVIDKNFREYKSDADVGLGLQMEEGNLVCQVPPYGVEGSIEEDDGGDMFEYGFVGLGNLALYKDFRARWGGGGDGDAVLEPFYDRDAVLGWIDSKVSSSSSVVLTTTMAKGEEVAGPTIHVMDEKHRAELVAITRKLGDCYVYENGVLEDVL